MSAWASLAAAAAETQGLIVPVPVPSPLAIRFYRSGNWLWMLSTLWELSIPALIVFSGFSARLSDWSRRRHEHWYVVLVIYFLALTTILSVTSLPLDFYASFLRPHEYGLSSQTLAKWLRDEITNVGIVAAGGALFLWVPYLLLKHATRRWWLYTWFASIPVSLCLMLVEPVWIEPLFNHFAPLPDGALKARIVALADRAGIEDAAIFEVDKSADTNESNAYVTGIGGTKRIVLWDTIIEQSTPDELLATVGHEMGHYVLRHVMRGLVVGSLAALVGLWLVHVCATRIISRWGGRIGIASLADPPTVPLFLLLTSAISLVMQPAVLAYSRHLEHEADRFGLEITRNNHACATTFVHFVEHDLAYPSPGPLYRFWRSSHPPLSERIEFCNRYHPWLNGEPSVYSRYFKSP